MTDPQVFPPLVVRVDPASASKALTPTIVTAQVLILVWAAIAVVVGALVGSTSGFGPGLAFGLPLVICVALMVYLLKRFTAQRGHLSIPRTTLVLDAAGLRSTIVQGSLTLPWAVIESVSLSAYGRQQIVKYRLAPTTTTDTPGVESTVTPAFFRLVVSKGFGVGSAGIDTPIQTVLDATASFTQGRLIVR